jgi:hypothetical protein
MWWLCMSHSLLSFNHLNTILSQKTTQYCVRLLISSPQLNTHPSPQVPRMPKGSLALTQTNMPTHSSPDKAPIRSLRTARRKSSKELAQIHLRTLFFARMGRFPSSSVKTSPSKRSSKRSPRRTITPQSPRISSSVSFSSSNLRIHKFTLRINSFSIVGTHVVPRTYISDPAVQADIKRREDRCRQNGGIGAAVVIIQCGGVSQVMPVEVDPPGKISWDSRTDWAEVLRHFVDSGRTDFKPISSTPKG